MKVQCTQLNIVPWNVGTQFKTSKFVSTILYGCSWTSWGSGKQTKQDNTHVLYAYACQRLLGSIFRESRAQLSTLGRRVWIEESAGCHWRAGGEGAKFPHNYENVKFVWQRRFCLEARTVLANSACLELSCNGFMRDILQPGWGGQLGWAMQDDMPLHGGGGCWDSMQEQDGNFQIQRKHWFLGIKISLGATRACSGPQGAQNIRSGPAPALRFWLAV